MSIPILDMLRPRRDAMLDALRPLVEHESPSADKARLDALAQVLAERFERLGGAVELLANSHGGDHLRVRFDFGAPRNAPPALLLVHFDTVWPVGTLGTMPFLVQEGKAHGPGIFDMKASLVLVEFALSALREQKLQLPRPVVVLFTSDEEIGSPTSRVLVEDESEAAAFALVLEPPLPDGALKTARKGVGRFRVEVEGRAAHAGIEPEKGVSAIVELAQQILRIHALNDLKAGTTVNVGVIEGGSVPNVIAARAGAELDVRVATATEAKRVQDAIQRLEPIADGISITISGRLNRPPMERTATIADLFEQARRIGQTLGLELTEGATGGGSDGNFTAALGVPTLDGLGTPGAGAHSTDEHILIDALPERAALLAALLLQLERPL